MTNARTMLVAFVIMLIIVYIMHFIGYDDQVAELDHIQLIVTAIIFALLAY